MKSLVMMRRIYPRLRFLLILRLMRILLQLEMTTGRNATNREEKEENINDAIFTKYHLLQNIHQSGPTSSWTDGFAGSVSVIPRSGGVIDSRATTNLPFTGPVNVYSYGHTQDAIDRMFINLNIN